MKIPAVGPVSGYLQLGIASWLEVRYTHEGDGNTPIKTMTYEIRPAGVSLAVIMTIVPGIMLMRLYQHLTTRPTPPGQCHECGYDLRGTLAAGRTECPECGHQIEADSKARA